MTTESPAKKYHKFTPTRTFKEMQNCKRLGHKCTSFEDGNCEWHSRCIKTSFTCGCCGKNTNYKRAYSIIFGED